MNFVTKHRNRKRLEQMLAGTVNKEYRLGMVDTAHEFHILTDEQYKTLADQIEEGKKEPKLD